MKVFKLYFKLVKSQLPVICMYFGIFLVLIFAFIGSGQSESDMFEIDKVKVAFVNYDGDSPLVEGYKQYLSKYAIFTDTKEEDFEDAFFFEEINVGLIIPAGFSEDFKNGGIIDIKTIGTGENMYSVTISQATNNYFSFFKTYQNTLHKDDNEVKEMVLDALEKEAVIEYSAKNVSSNNSLGRFFNYLSYIFLSVIVSIICTVMLKIRRGEQKKRIITSPYKDSLITCELLLGNLIFALSMVAIFIIIALFMYNNMKSLNGLFFFLNILCYSLPVLGIGYLVGSLVKNENVVGAINNVLSLGTSFLCGVFVPQAYLGSGVLGFAHILPTYYYVRANELITQLQSFSYNDIKEVLLMYFIQIAFGALLFVINFIIGGKEKQKEN